MEEKGSSRRASSGIMLVCLGRCIVFLLVGRPAGIAKFISQDDKLVKYLQLTTQMSFPTNNTSAFSGKRAILLVAVFCSSSMFAIHGLDLYISRMRSRVAAWWVSD